MTFNTSFFLGLFCLVTTSCISHKPRVRFDPVHKRHMIQSPSAEGSSAGVKSPTRKEISEILNPTPIQVGPLLEGASGREASLPQTQHQNQHQGQHQNQHQNPHQGSHQNPNQNLQPSSNASHSVENAGSTGPIGSGGSGFQKQESLELSGDWVNQMSLVTQSDSRTSDEKVDLCLKVIEYTFSQGLGVEAMANELKKKAPELLELLDYWLLGKLWDQNRYDEASRFASQLIKSSYPKIQEKAQYLFDQYYLTRKASAQNIGVLLPVQNKHSVKLLNALKIAFGHIEGSQSSYQLKVIDEPDEAQKYEEVFLDFIRKDNVIAIVGGLRSKNRHEISRLSQKYKIPFIYMGQKSRVTEDNPYVFQYGLTNESQIRASVLHAQAQGIKKIAMVYPNDGFGVESANLFWDEWSAVGGEVVAAYTYHPQENDFQEIAAKLSNKFYLHNRMEEFAKLQKDKIAKEPSSKKKILSQSPSELLPAEFDFEAIFIPDVNRAMVKITSALAYYGIRRLPVYGTRLWANQETFKLAGSMWASYLVIPESIYNQPDLFQIQHPFYWDYQKISGIKPDHTEVAAYEVSLLLKGILSSQKIDSREALRGALSGTYSVPGVLNQSIYFDEYREIESPIVLLRFNHLGQLIPTYLDMP
jgi:ABC-type branched-subunit amino acid transport system substrate-binding protein